MNLSSKERRLMACFVALIGAFIAVCICTALNGTPAIQRLDPADVAQAAPDTVVPAAQPMGNPVIPANDARAIPDTREISVSRYHTFVLYGQAMDEAIRADLEPDLRELAATCGYPLVKEGNWTREADTMWFLRTDAKDKKDDERRIKFTFDKGGVFVDFGKPMTPKDRDALETTLCNLSATLDYPLPQRVEWVRETDQMWLLRAAAR